MHGSLGVIFSEDNKKVLLVKRGEMPVWVLPGGRIEKDESPEDAAIREVFEETGFVVTIDKKIAEYSYTKESRILHTYLCKIQSGTKTLCKESKAIEEFKISALPEFISPHLPVYINDAVLDSADVIKKEMHGFGLRFWLKALKHPWALFKYMLTKVGIHWNFL